MFRLVRRWGGRCLRVATLLFLLSLALGWVVARQVSARVDEAMLLTGEGLAALLPPRPGQRQVLINGQELLFEHRIRERDRLGLVAAARLDCETRESSRFRYSGEGARGVAVCVDASSFVYTYAQSLDGGSRMVRVESGSGFRLDQLFPEHGDVPGWDTPDLPRPPGSDRRLCAGERGAGYSLRLYRGGRIAARDLLPWMRSRLAREGWHLADAEEAILLGHKDRRMVLLSIAEDEEGRALLLMGEGAAAPKTSRPL